VPKVSNEEHKQAPLHKENPEDSSVLEKHKTFNLKVVNAFNLDLLQAMYPQASPYPICEGYKRNYCKHGRDGKTEVDGVPCKQLHPKKCYPWINAGTDSRLGCNKGKDCDYYHPILCRNSVRYRRCLNAECTFAHLKYTKRYRRNNERNRPNNDHRETHESIATNRPQNNQQLPWKSQEEAQNQPAAKVDNVNVRSFLEDLVQSLRKDIQVNQKEMREFKHTITQQVSQIHHNLPQYQQVHIDPTVAHHQIHQNHPQHHQVQIDPSSTHNQMQHIQVNQPEGATLHLVPQSQMMMKPLGRI
jgi:hypothetical protein